jgi:hypothetical protein
MSEVIDYAIKKTIEKVKKPLVRWTSDEWDKLAIALHLEFPHKNYHISEKLSLGLGPLMAVMRKTIEESRWRVFHTGNDYKPYLLKAYARLRPTLIKHEADKAAAIAEVLTNEVTEIHGVVSDSVPGTLPGEPIPTEPGDVPGRAKQSRIFWNEAEWLCVARELYRLHPHLIRSDTLVGVKLPELMFAQKSLPQERQRNAIINMSQAREKLLEAFKIIRTEVQESEATRKAQEASEAAAAQEASRNPFEKAIEPLIALITAEVMKALMPRIQALVGTVQQQPELGFDPFPKEHVSKPKKPKVAVVGALPVQQAAIALEFPEIDFVMPDKDAKNTPSQVNGCDRVIAMVSFMDHSQRHALKNKFGEKFSEVSGGTSSIKRLISVLLASGGIPKPAAAVHH